MTTAIVYKFTGVRGDGIQTLEDYYRKPEQWTMHSVYHYSTEYMGQAANLATKDSGAISGDMVVVANGVHHHWNMVLGCSYDTLMYCKPDDSFVEAMERRMEKDAKTPDYEGNFVRVSLKAQRRLR